MATKKRSRSNKGREKVREVMHEYKHGQLKSGGRKKVKNPKQAIAIALSEARESGANIPDRRPASKKRAAAKKTAATKKTSSAKKTAAKKKTAAGKTARSGQTAAKKAPARKKAAAKKTAAKRSRR